MFTHLHARSWFSFLAGGSSPEALAARAADLGMPAAAITDRNGTYGVVRFIRACRANGIKPIVGAEITVEGAPLVLIARTQRGYANLCRLATAAHMASREKPSAAIEQLAEYADDLFCLTGGREGYLHQLATQLKGREGAAWLGQLREIFTDRLRVEISHYCRPGDSALALRLRDLATRASVPIVATGDVRYATHEEYRRYSLLTCIRHGIHVYDMHPERPVNGESYMKNEAQLRRLILFPEAFENAADIARACDIDLIPGYLTPPTARLPEGASATDILERLCIAALEERYPGDRHRHARAQLHKELGVILGLQLEEFFLVVREVVHESRRRGIRCAGRGSAANSIVAYLLGITGVDPLAHNLLFERFLHGGRKGTPDIDIDFDSDRRGEIIAWMEERFGMEQTAMTGTIVTYGIRMALRDVAKALGWPLETVDRLTRSVPPTDPKNVWEYRDRLVAIVGESALFDALLTATASLQGCPRHLGQHSGGMVLSHRPLFHFTPVQVSANGVKLVQFDKNDIEAMGLIKLDVLGLRMLAALNETLEILERAGIPPPDIDELPLDDPATYALIKSGQTLGVFQIESQGQMHLLAKNQPECFDDLISEIALFRPGPLQGGMVNPFIRRRQGLEPVEYMHEDLEPILRDTYGVILFQEQVLDVAHRFAGMSLQEADDFRALMSRFRSPGDMQGMRAKFVRGAVTRDVPEATAHEVFDKLANFVGYGFCRSHAAAFAKTVYQSAWLKCHYPAAFMAAIMQHRPGMYSLTTLEQDARRIGVPVLFPEVNRSGMRYALEYTPAGTLAIRKPLTGITELSPDDARAIVLERMRGPFSSVEDLYTRVPLARDVLEYLARSGALDELAGTSRRALWQIGVLANRLGPTGHARPSMLFDLPALDEADIPDLPPLTQRERLTWDYVAQSSARRHPMTLVRRELNDLEIRTIATCRRMAPSPARTGARRDPILTIAGVVILRQMPPTANGVMFVTLEDETGFIQCIVQPHVRALHDATIFTSPALAVRGTVQMVKNWRGIVVHEAWSLTGVLGGYEGWASSHGGTDRLIVGTETAQDVGVRGFEEGDDSHTSRSPDHKPSIAYSPLE